MSDVWDPAQYERFKRERSQPFFDLLALVHPISGGAAVDLGSGTGELTAQLHAKTGARETVGVERSDAMREKSKAFETPGLRFEQGDIATYTGGPFDLVFSNAALQWLPDHVPLFTRIAHLVAPGGQLAVQVPANHDHPSHTVAQALAQTEPFAQALGGHVRQSPVLPPEQYAGLLHDLGFADQRVALQVYGHVLPSRDGVVEWVRGTLLTDYQSRLPPELFEQFLEAYRARLNQALPDARPFFYPFKRILIWARRAA